MFLLAKFNFSVAIKKRLLVAHAQLALCITYSYEASVAARTIGVNFPG